MKGFIVYPSYKVIDEKAYVYLYGRLENNESFVAIQFNRPYLYIKQKDREKAEEFVEKNNAEFDFEATKLKNFDDEPVTKIILDNPRDVPKVKTGFLSHNIQCYEADIRFAYRYLIDHDLKGSIEIEGNYDKGREGENEEFNVDRVYRDAKIKPSDQFPKLKTLSIDIETDRKGENLYSISLYTGDFTNVLIVKEKKYKNAESVRDERQLLERFKEIVLELDPDIILGWNVVDFDLNILKNKFNHYRIPFRLGREDSECSINLSDSFFIDSSARFPGRMVLDGISLMKTSFIKLQNYKLGTAAWEFLGEKKLFTSDNRTEEIENAYKNNPQKLVDYNLKDAKLAFDVVKASGALELTIKRSMLTRMQLDRVKASIASLDSLYLKELQKKGYVAPTANPEERGERIKGGFVRDSKPGIYENIIVLDFKSLYPSIIRTFNIDPLSFVEKSDIKKFKKSELIEAPNKAYFKNKEGILPQIIQSLWKQRDAAKKKRDKLGSNAIKILMNSMFGVLANPTCRFYSIDMANAITHFGQFLIKLAADKIEEKGHEVIYGDTDSLFVNANENSYTKTKKLGSEIQEHINHFFEKHVRENYKRKNFMELEFEKVYKKFLLPHVRGSDVGAKKRYVGIIEKDGKDVMDFVGLEFVRSDWTDISKKFQLELLDRIFHEKDVGSYISKFIASLRAGKHDDLLVYRKSIRKPVSAYIKTTPPHIKAARKIGRDKTGTIEYLMTLDGPEAIEAIKHKIDYQHYIEKQLKPIADSVLIFFDSKFEDFSEKQKQKNLFDY